VTVRIGNISYLIAPIPIPVLWNTFAPNEIALLKYSAGIINKQIISQRGIPKHQKDVLFISRIPLFPGWA